MPPEKPKNGIGKEKAQNGGDLGFETELLRQRINCAAIWSRRTSSSARAR
jgi:hypothetical protein